MKMAMRAIGLSMVLMSGVMVTGCAKEASAKNDAPAQLVTFHVTGMHCASCEEAIQGSVAKIPGVQECTASHDKEEVTVKLTDAHAEDAVKKAITGLGYTVGDSPRQGG
ncbi:MAG TPA: heavy metal-associated domain-containing protein [Phycisphaerales bacterium]|nr:heavy metal-associated domain-containing protein [Phycisphaerales bacterium]